MKRQGEEDHKEVKRYGEACQQSRQGESKESGHGEDYHDEEKMIQKRRKNCKKNRKRDIDEAKRQFQQG